MNYPAVAALTVLFFSPAYSLEYESDIMPFLAEKCGECHGKETKAKGGLKLDDPQHLAGRFAKNSVIVPGDWDASMLFITLFRPPDHKDAMPPKGKVEGTSKGEEANAQK